MLAMNLPKEAHTSKCQFQTRFGFTASPLVDQIRKTFLNTYSRGNDAQGCGDSQIETRLTFFCQFSHADKGKEMGYNGLEYC